jgi:AcrR family transcriptional regulator
MSKNDKIKSKETVNGQIIRAARQLFQVHGLAKITMDDIGKMIGRHRSSLYHYYKSKEEVYQAVKDIEIAETIAFLTEKIAENGLIGEKFRIFCECILFVDQTKLASITSTDIEVDSIELSAYGLMKQAIHLRFVNAQDQLLLQMISEAIAGDQLPESALPAAKNLIFLLGSSLHGIRKQMILTSDYSGIPEFAKILADMAIRNLTSIEKQT